MKGVRFMRRAARINAVSALAGLRRGEHRLSPRASQERIDNKSTANRQLISKRNGDPPLRFKRYIKRTW
jgi:hypothetical protein